MRHNVEVRQRSPGVMARLKRLLNPPCAWLQRDRAKETAAQVLQLEEFLAVLSVRKDGQSSCLALGHVAEHSRWFLRALRLEIVQGRRIGTGQAENLPWRGDFVCGIGRASFW
jgi:hypothetical protein